MADLTLTATGQPGALNLAWNFSALTGTSFKVELLQTLNTTTKPIYTAASTTTKTGSFVDSSALDTAPPPSPAVETDTMKFNSTPKQLSFSWGAISLDTGTKYTYTLKVTDLATSKVYEVQTVTTVTSTLKGYVYKISTDPAAKLTLTDNPTTATKATVTLSDAVGLKYILIASVDSSNNMGEILSTPVDVEAPSAPSTIVLNGHTLTVGGGKPAIPYDPNGFTLDIKPSSHVRGLHVFYDITFVVGGRTLYSAKETPLPLGVEYKGDILAEIPTIDKNTQFIITVKSYTSLGSSAGTKQFIFVLNTETVKYTLNWAPNSANKRFLTSSTDSIKVSWGLTESDVTIKQYELFIRSKQADSPSWSAWKSLGKSPDLSKTLTGVQVGYTGNTVYNFAVSGVTATDTLPKKILPDLYGDIFYVNASGSERLTVLAKLPQQILQGVSLQAGYQLKASGPVNSRDLVSITNDGTIIGKVGVDNDQVNETTVFPAPKPTGYDFTQPASLKEFETAILSAFEMYRTSAGYIKPLTEVRYEPTNQNDYYAVLIDIPVGDKRLKDVTYVYDGLIGIGTLGDISLKFSSTPAVTQVVAKNYKLLTFKDLPAPVLTLDNNPTPVSIENGIKAYKPPLSASTTLPTALAPLASSLRLVTSYDYSSKEGSGTIPAYENGTPITNIGAVTMYSKIVYTYGSGTSSIIKESPETALSFLLIDTSKDLIVPTLSTEYVAGKTGVDFLVSTNVKDISKYTYIIHDTDGDTQYTTYTTENDSNGNKVLRLRFPNEGEYKVTVDFSLEGSGSGSQTLAFTVYAVTAATGSIMRLDKVSKDPAYQGAGAYAYLGDTSRLQSKGFIYNLKYADKNILIKEGYKIPILRSGALSLSQYRLNDYSRNRLISVDGRRGSMTPTSMTRHDTQSANLTSIRPTEAPPQPTLVHTSPNPVKGDLTTGLVAIDSITFTLGNKSPDATYSLFLDSKPFTEGTPLTRSGKHVITAVASSKFNYITSTLTVHVEVKTPNMIFPPQIVMSPRFHHSITKTITVLTSNTVDAETSTLEYKLSTDNVWKAYTAPVTVDKPLTFTARKTFTESKRALSSELEITADMLSKFPTEEANLGHLQQSVGFISIPAIDQQIGVDYALKIDGVPYPLWAASKPVLGTQNRVQVIATTKRTREQSAPKEATVNFNMAPAPTYSIPNLVSSLKMIKMNPNTLLELNDPTARAEVYVDGKRVEVGRPMFDPATINGIHTIVIISRNPVNYSLATTSYVINVNNYSTADTSYGTTSIPRTAILPLNREAGIYDTPGELMVDTRTADISIVGTNLSPVEITKELRLLIRSKDQVIGEVNKSIEFIKVSTETLRTTAESLFGPYVRAAATGGDITSSTQYYLTTDSSEGVILPRPNLLPSPDNPTIRNGREGTWIIRSGGNGTVDLLPVDNPPRPEIQKMLRVRDNTNGNNKDLCVFTDLEVGEKYTISAWARVSRTSTQPNVKLLFRCWCDDTKDRNGKLLSPTISHTDWKWYSFTFTADSNNNSSIQFGQNGDGNIEVCGMRCVKGDRDDPWTGTIPYLTEDQPYLWSYIADTHRDGSITTIGPMLLRGRRAMGIRRITEIVERIQREWDQVRPTLNQNMTTAANTANEVRTFAASARPKFPVLEGTILEKKDVAKIIILNQTRPALDQLRASVDEVLGLISEVAQSYYNLESINITANRKVTKAEFARFSSQAESAYNNLAHLIDTF